MRSAYDMNRLKGARTRRPRIIVLTAKRMNKKTNEKTWTRRERSIIASREDFSCRISSWVKTIISWPLLRTPASAFFFSKSSLRPADFARWLQAAGGVLHIEPDETEWLSQLRCRHGFAEHPRFPGKSVWPNKRFQPRLQIGFIKEVVLSKRRACCISKR